MTDTRTNVDPTELAKFDALASRWWDPEGEFRPLHEINPLRLDWIRQHVDLKGMRTVDIGCGGGILAESMAAAGAKVTGIDMAEGPLSVARRATQSLTPHILPSPTHRSISSTDCVGYIGFT